VRLTSLNLGIEPIWRIPWNLNKTQQNQPNNIKQTILGQTPNKRLTNKRTIDEREKCRKRPRCSPRGRDSLINSIVGYFMRSKKDIRAEIKKVEKQILAKEHNS
jgi:hypothetical protein